MKNIILLAITAILLFTGNTFAQTNPTEDEKAIIAVMNQFGAAWESGDMKTFGDLLSDNVVHISPFGEIETGRTEVQKVMKWVREVPYKGVKLQMTISEYSVNFSSADGAVVTLKVTTAITGTPKPIEERVTFSVARIGSQWKITHFQGVMITEPPVKMKS